jgi:transposase-like protein
LWYEATQRRKKAWAKWGRLVSQQAKSGQSVAAFCHEHGLCAPHFFTWKKRLNEVGTGKSEKFAEVTWRHLVAQSMAATADHGHLQGPMRALFS